MNIYVGNLSREVTDEDLQEAFEAFGQVASVSIIKDRITGVPRGFGFVEIPEKAEAQSAIDGLSGTELKGQAVNVNEARPRSEGRGGGDEVRAGVSSKRHWDSYIARTGLEQGSRQHQEGTADEWTD